MSSKEVTSYCNSSNKRLTSSSIEAPFEPALTERDMIPFLIYDFPVDAIPARAIAEFAAPMLSRRALACCRTEITMSFSIAIVVRTLPTFCSISCF